MDRSALLRETYDKIVEKRNKIIIQLDNCRFIVDEAKKSIQVARTQYNEAITADDEILKGLTVARNLIGESPERSQPLHDKLDELTVEQFTTSKKRIATEEILRERQRALLTAEKNLASAEQLLKGIDKDRDDIAEKIERNRLISA